MTRAYVLTDDIYARLHISVRQIEVAEITPTKVTHGGTYDNNEEFRAANSVDLDLSTMSATPYDAGTQWLKLELDKKHFVHKIKVYCAFYKDWYKPNGWCVQSEEKFKQCVDSETNVDVSVYLGDVKQKSCRTLQLTYGLEQSDQIYTLICNTEGDHVILSKDAGTIDVCEAVISGPGIY